MEQYYISQLAAHTLTVAEQAEVVRLLYDVPIAQRFCSKVGQQLSKIVTTDWIATAPLYEVFAVLDALHYYQPTELSGAQMAAIAKRLMGSEVTVGGPYADKGGVATRANAYIASCMTWMAASLPKVEQYLIQKLDELQTAAAVNKALNFEDTWNVIVIRRSLPQAVALAFPQLPIPRNTDDPRAVAMALRQDNTQKANSQPLYNQAASNAAAITAAVQNSYAALPGELRTSALTALRQLVEVDNKYEIRLLASFFANAYHAKTTVPIADQTFVQLGTANVHVWLAYTIYDDFLDDEGQPALLSIANVALRAAAEAYRDILPSNAGFQDFVKQAFTTVDAANAWEIAYWRLDVSAHSITLGAMPDYADRQRLADRALLHIVGPMTVLAATGSTPADAVWQDTLTGLRHYLIARQLTDDLHDWDEDLRAGHVTYIVAEIIRGLGLPKGVYTFERLMPHAHDYFWLHALPGLCQTISEHIQQARVSLRPYMSADRNQLFTFLDGLEASVQAALQQRQQGQEFLRELA